jgi:hypothetical protein
MNSEEIMEMARQAGFTQPEGETWYEAFPQCIEAFAKLVAAKAIAELESQEPVAWVAEDVCEGQYIDGRPRKIWWECEKGVGTAFYAHPPQRTEERNFCPRCGKRTADLTVIHTCTPPQGIYYTPSQRTWVGLTVEEIAACCMESTTTQLSFYNAIEAKLKEKNT